MDTRTRATTEPGIELTIDELVLDGLLRSGRYALAEALERELARLIVERGAPFLNRLDAMPVLDAGTFEVAANATPQAIGQQIALTLYEGMERCARD